MSNLLYRGSVGGGKRLWRLWRYFHWSSENGFTGASQTQGTWSTQDQTDRQ